MGVSPVFEYQCVWSRVRPRSWWFGSFSVCAVADNSFYNSSHCLLTWRAWMCTWLFCCPFLHREIKWPYFIIFFFFLSWYKMALFYSFWFFQSFWARCKPFLPTLETLWTHGAKQPGLHEYMKKGKNNQEALKCLYPWGMPAQKMHL